MKKFVPVAVLIGLVAVVLAVILPFLAGKPVELQEIKGDKIPCVAILVDQEGNVVKNLELSEKAIRFGMMPNAIKWEGRDYIMDEVAVEGQKRAVYKVFPDYSGAQRIPRGDYGNR